MAAKLIRRGSSGGTNGGSNIPNMATMTQEEQQAYNRAQAYQKGFTVTSVAGSTTSFPLQLGGSCRKLWGMVIFVPTANVNDDDIISLSVNEEVIIDKSNWKIYSPASSGNTFKPNEYYELRRALSGNDSVEFTIQSVNAHNVFITMWLSQA
jgi:hypothetical protein